MAERVESIPFRRLLFHNGLFGVSNIHTNGKPTAGPASKVTANLDYRPRQVAPVFGIPNAFLAAVSHQV
jgi:hypothetical protein